jgi:hypothetical protein
MAQVGIKKMDNDIPVINNHPAAFGTPLDAALLFVFLACLFDCRIRQRIEHAVAGGSTDNKIICEGNHFFDIQEKNIFPFLIFQSIYDRMCKFQSVQRSPLY